MIIGYFNVGEVVTVIILFNFMFEIDVIVWIVMILGYV